VNKTLLLNTVGKHDYLAFHVGKSGCFCGIDLPSARKEVFTFYGPIFARQQIMVILAAAAAAPLLCVCWCYYWCSPFSVVFTWHTLPHSLKAHARAPGEKKLFPHSRSAAELVKYLHKNDSPAHSPADIAHNKVEILMVCVTSNAAAFAPRARSLAKGGKNDENFALATTALWHAASLSALLLRDKVCTSRELEKSKD
jgi:hypothetical protein